MKHLIENYLSKPGTCITYNTETQKIRVITYPARNLLIDGAADNEIKASVCNMLAFFQRCLDDTKNGLNEDEKEGVNYMISHMRNVLNPDIVELDLLEGNNKGK